MSTNNTTTEIAVRGEPQDKLDALSAGIRVEQMLARPQAEESAPPEDNGFGGGFPYIGFRGAKSKNTEGLDAVGIRTQEFYLHNVVPIKIRDGGLDLHLLQYFRAFTKQNSRMEIVGVSRVMNDAIYKQGYREHLFSLVAVRQPTTHGLLLTPAVMSVRGAQCKALGKAIDMLSVADDAKKWAGLGAFYAHGSRAKVAGGRFYTSIWSTLEEPKNEGEPYNLGHGVAKPCDEKDVTAFNEWYLPETDAVLRRVALVHYGRQQDLLKKLREQEAKKAKEDAKGYDAPAEEIEDAEYEPAPV